MLVNMKISDTPLFYFFKITPPILPTAPYLWEEKSPLVPPYNGGGWDPTMLELFQVKKVVFIDWKIALWETDNFGCLRFNTFDFQLKFNLKHTNFVLIKEN